MAFIIPTDWISGQAYTTDTQVTFNGVVYRALQDVTSTTNPSQDGDNWAVVSVTRIQDYNSLVEAVRLQLNTRSNPEIDNSIPLFIQLTEESFKTRIRAPQQRRTVTLTVDSSSRIQPPGDLLEVLNLRYSGGTTVTATRGRFERADIEILNANYEEYRRVLEAEQNGVYTNRDSFSFDSAVFWFDNRYFHLAPAFPSGAEMELVYYKSIPQLGTQFLLTDSAGNPLNDQGQTAEQWIAQGGGNTRDNFVQATRTTLRNWFTNVVPQLLLYGACLKAAPYLKEAEGKVEMWKQLYAEAEAETHTLIDMFENDQPHVLFIENAYSSNI